jgi:hypothetical protein
MDPPRHRGGRTLLEDLSLELVRIAALLAWLAERDAARRESPATGPAEAAETALRRLEAAIAARRARSAVFGLDLDNPGWNLMLELYRARLEGREPSAARLATDARLSMSTLARWRRRLVASGHAAAPGPGERAFALTDSAADSISDYFAALAIGFAEPR